jgi:RimJ/RimL family protein N-acetyltransferase
MWEILVMYWQRIGGANDTWQKYLQKMLAVWFATFALQKIVGYCDVDNIASAKVMEKARDAICGCREGALSKTSVSEMWKRDANAVWDIILYKYTWLRLKKDI